MPVFCLASSFFALFESRAVLTQILTLLFLIDGIQYYLVLSSFYASPPMSNRIFDCQLHHSCGRARGIKEFRVWSDMLMARIFLPLSTPNPNGQRASSTSQHRWDAKLNSSPIRARARAKCNRSNDRSRRHHRMWDVLTIWCDNRTNACIVHAMITFLVTLSLQMSAYSRRHPHISDDDLLKYTRMQSSANGRTFSQYALSCRDTTTAIRTAMPPTFHWLKSCPNEGLRVRSVIWVTSLQLPLCSSLANSVSGTPTCLCNNISRANFAVMTLSIL